MPGSTRLPENYLSVLHTTEQDVEIPEPFSCILSFYGGVVAVNPEMAIPTQSGALLKLLDFLRQIERVRMQAKD